MIIKYKLLGLVGLFLFILSCNSQEKLVTLTQREDWKINNYIDSVQILLSNDYKFDKSSSAGASSFLLKTNTDTLLCTAKHLLGDAMGISPEVSTDSFNLQFKSWIAFPRNNKLTNDTIRCSKLINEEINNVDIILLDCAIGENNKIQVLRPRLSEVEPGEALEIIGCEYSQTDCYQNKYEAIMVEYDEGTLFVQTIDDFEPTGFSGAPVIDSYGFVVGVLSGSVDYAGEQYLVIEPLTKVMSHLK